MRIVAGKHRGAKLTVPDGLDVRPTPERAREALFSMLESGRLGSGFRGGSVLDLFAGSGALGLEALSRGAERVVLVDTHPAALDALRANVAKLKAGARAQVRSGDATRLHERAPAAAAVVFMDPPYGSGDWFPAIEAADRCGWIAADTLVVVEVDRREQVEPPPGFEVIDDRTYGRARLAVLRRSPGANGPDTG